MDPATQVQLPHKAPAAALGQTLYAVFVVKAVDNRLVGRNTDCSKPRSSLLVAMLRDR